MNAALQTTVDRYIESREAVKSVFRMENEYSFPVAANIYVTAGMPVDTERLTDCKRLIKEKAGIFSNFRGSILVPLAAKLAISDDPEKRWDRAASNYAVLKEHFMRSEYLALAALLLTDSASDEDVSALAARGRELYRRMKEAHPFLTGQEDSVFAVLLAQCPGSDDALITDMEACYRLLDERFPKGDGIQTASHVLAMTDGAPIDKVRRVIALYDALTGAEVKFGKDRQLSALAAFAGETASVPEIASEICEVDAALADRKGYRGLFGYERRTRSMHAAMLVSTCRAKARSGLVNAIAQQSAVAMIAAQQSAMICAMVACSAATASAASSAH